MVVDITYRGCTMSPVPLLTESSGTTQTADGVVSPGPTPMGTRLNEIACCTLFPGDRVNGALVKESVPVNEFGILACMASVLCMLT